MYVVLSGIVMLDKLEHSLNVPALMLVTLLLIVAFIMLEQALNAYSSMFVTLFGIVMLDKLEQPLNAKCPMLVTLFRIVTFVILVYDDGKTMLIFELHIL